MHANRAACSVGGTGTRCYWMVWIHPWFDCTVRCLSHVFSDWSLVC